MVEQNLSEKMQELFSQDEDIQEWIILGKLPQEIAEITATALEPKKERTNPIRTPGSAPEEIDHISRVVQKEFWPDAPSLQKGGFMNAMLGGPMPDWMLRGQISWQIVVEMRNRGYEVEFNDPFDNVPQKDDQ